jgi:aminopeptidase
MSLEELEEFAFGAVSIDWPAMRDELQRRKAQFEAGREVRILGRDTDLRLGVAGRSWIPDDGAHNMPGGEIFTGPVEDGVEGEIAYDFPAVYGGREVDGVRLRFKAGLVVDASARTGEDYLIKMLDADEGARRLGELGIGTNYGITTGTREILLDEKIGGTVHMAIGASYPESGGVNESAVHWDFVCDLRKGGSISVDGVEIQRDGAFLI